MDDGGTGAPGERARPPGERPPTPGRQVAIVLGTMTVFFILLALLATWAAERG